MPALGHGHMSKYRPGRAGQHGPTGRLAEADRNSGQPEARTGGEKKDSGEPAGRSLCQLVVDRATCPSAARHASSTRESSGPSSVRAL
eukprot:scaffold59978_cov61-Phaeocystis_antarctica.AAC.4